MQWQGSYGRKLGKENKSTTRNPDLSTHFTSFHTCWLRKAVNKENLSTPKLAQRSLHCKDAKPLRFFLQVLYSFMRRVASVFSTGRGFQNQVIDSMATWSLSYTAIGLGRNSTTWLRITVFLASSKQTHLLAIHVKYTKCRVTWIKSTGIISHHASLHFCFTIMVVTAVVSASKLFVFRKASAAFGAAEAHLQLRPLRRATNTWSKEWQLIGVDLSAWYLHNIRIATTQ